MFSLLRDTDVQRSFRPTQDAVVLVHGLGANRFLLAPLAEHLRRIGLQPHNWGYSSLSNSIEFHADRLSAKLRKLASDPQVERIFLVTHSMGSIVARRALQQTDVDKLHRIVMLGPPNRGSRVARNLSRFLGFLCKPLRQLSDAPSSFVNQLPEPRNVEVGVLGAEFDRVVSESSTHLDCQRDHRIIPTGHTSMLFRQDVATLVENFLRYGRFETRLPARLAAEL